MSKAEVARVKATVVKRLGAPKMNEIGKGGFKKVYK
jgi:hypothetical protein